MRLFTGIAIPPELVTRLSRLIEHLRVHAHLRWTNPYNLHITTKFIGEWPEDRLDELKQRLSQVGPHAAFPLQISGFGWFPNPHNPRTLWMSLKPGDQLRELVSATEAATAELGIAKEDKVYTPHITIARVKEPNPLTALKRAIADLKTDDVGSFEVNAWHLYLSRPGPSGSIYTQLSEIPLRK